MEMHDSPKILCRKLNLPVDWYKQVTNDNSSLRYMFNKLARVRPTRRQNELTVDVVFTRTETDRKSFCYRGPAFWNNVTSDIKVRLLLPSIKAAYTANLLRDINHSGEVIL